MSNYIPSGDPTYADDSSDRCLTLNQIGQPIVTSFSLIDSASSLLLLVAYTFNFPKINVSSLNLIGSRLHRDILVADDASSL